MEENCGGGSGGYSGARPPWERRSLRKKRTEKQRRPPLEDNCAKEGNLNKVIFFSFRMLQKSSINNLCTYDLYCPVHNVLDACISITRGNGRGVGPWNF
jgi:hypothetical protein